MRNDEINKNEPWLEKFKEKVDNYTEPTPAFGWEQLEKELNSPKVIPMFSKKRPWAYAAAAAILAALSAIGLHYMHSPHIEDLRQAAIEVIEQNPDVLLPIAQPEKSMNIAQAESFKHSNSSKNGQKTNVSAIPSQTIIDNNIVAQDSQNEPIIINDHSEQNTNIVSTSNKNDISASASQQAQQNQNQAQTRVARSKPSSKDKLHIPIESKANKDNKRWAMGAGISNAGNFASNNQYAYNNNISRVDFSVQENGVMPIPENYTIIFNEGIPYLVSTDEIIDAKHHQPIAIGVAFSYPLKHGLSIETGITFTLLSSDITKASNPNLSLSQKLYYLGIPVKMNWSFLEKRYVTLYTTVGGQIEKAIHGKLGNEKISDKPLQFSVMAGLGVQANITTHFGIYIEPGVAYFFKNNSKIQTIRKEHPCNFNMQAGIRYTY